MALTTVYVLKAIQAGVVARLAGYAPLTAKVKLANRHSGTRAAAAPYDEMPSSFPYFHVKVVGCPIDPAAVRTFATEKAQNTSDPAPTVARYTPDVEITLETRDFDVEEACDLIDDVLGALVYAGQDLNVSFEGHKAIKSWRFVRSNIADSAGAAPDRRVTPGVRSKRVTILLRIEAEFQPFQTFPREV